MNTVVDVAKSDAGGAKMTETEMLFKVLDGKKATKGGRGEWPRVGTWLNIPDDRPLVPCNHGLHLCRKQDLVKWLGPTIYVAEYRGDDVVHDDSKVVVRSARLKKQIKSWNAKNQRLFACDVAEHALDTYSNNPPGSSYDAIEVARRFTHGKATQQELYAAFYAACYAAAAAATANAANAAAYAANAANAAYAAERLWQTELLFDKYLEL
jgi:hypothetical protein